MRLFEGTQFDIPPTCDRCGKLEKECRCPPLAKPGIPADQQTAQLSLEKRKRGKLVTVVRGLADDASLVPLLAKLKSSCGAGGTLNDGVLELQGDHVARIKAMLLTDGYRVSR